MPEKTPEKLVEVDLLKQEKSLLQDKVYELEVMVRDIKARLEKRDVSQIKRVERRTKKPTIIKAKLGGR
jgi:ppGpp synthetase/RelA/SpoT-type nucleotidyltranferase